MATYVLGARDSTPEGLIDMLNKLLRAEHGARIQYERQATMLDLWGYGRLAKVTRDRAAQEGEHHHELMERILFLGGEPDLAQDEVIIGDLPDAMIAAGDAAERQAIEDYNAAIKLACNIGGASDNATRALLEHILVEEEEHLAYLVAQEAEIRQIGFQNWLQAQIS